MKHLLLRLEKVTNVEALKHVESLQEVMDKVVDAMGFHVVETCDHQFKPFGATRLYLLSESHCSAHTFWEEEMVHLDVFCCTDFDHTRTRRLFLEGFGTTSYKETVVDRSNE